MTELQLNDEQCKAILTAGLERNLYENGGKIPDDPAVRMEDATKLVNAALAARKNKNRSDNVETILFIAQVDQKPDIKEPELVPQDSAHTNVRMHNGLDLASLSDAVIEGLITGLDKYPNSEQVEADRAAFTAERERRKNAQAQKGQEDPQAKTPGEAAEKPGEAATESPAPTSAVADQVTQRGRADGSGGTDGEASAGTSAQGEDAGAFARAQTEEPPPKGRKVKAKQNEEIGERSKLEEELTLPMVKAHGVDITKLSNLSTDELREIVNNPDGPSAKETKMPVDENEVEAAAVPKDKNVVGGVVPGVAAPEKEITKADLGLEVDEDEEAGTSGQVSAERERVESLITGPCLKAYRRGRKEIPTIGINELKLMALYPDAKISPEQLEQARETDKLGKEVVQEVRKVDAETQQPQMVVTKEVPGPEVVSHFLEVDPPEEEPQDNQGDAEQVVSVQQIVDKDTKLNQEAIDKHNKEYEIRLGKSESKLSGQRRALEIIGKENFPIPPEYDEEAPRFPLDASKISRDELFSLHAMYHAYEMRVNWVLSAYEDEMNDYIQMRNYREAEVAKSVPFIGEDGKRNTNEFREAQVNGDEEVIALAKKEHEVKKTVTDLKVLQKNFHLSCERLSRQMSKYETERLDAPR